jgi:uncharacterized protein (TIGR03086 family)
MAHMHAKQQFIETVLFATRYIDKVTAESFHQATPNAEWDVRTLAAHMLYELCWSAEIMAGKKPSDVGDVYEGDLIGDALQANWHAAAERAMGAARSTQLESVAHLSRGDVPMEDYVREISADLLIHTWDIGEGISEPVIFEDHLIKEAAAYLEPRVGEYEKKGLFAPSIIVPETADAQTRLLAMTGRRVNWPVI